MRSDNDYFLLRAEEEDARGAATDNEMAKDAHFKLAEFYRHAAQTRGPSLDDHKTGHSEFFIL